MLKQLRDAQCRCRASRARKIGNRKRRQRAIRADDRNLVGARWIAAQAVCVKV